MPVHTWLPVDLCYVAPQNKMVKPLQVYLYLKIFASGKCHQSSDVFSKLRKDLNIRDNRTLKKHLTMLQMRNWIGYNETSGYYFIRSYRNVLQQQKRYYLASKIELKDIKNLQAFITGVLLSDNIRRQKFFWKNKKKNSAATKKGEIANQLGLSSEPPKYYGLSNKGLALMLGCKQTRACVLKQKAKKAGYIRVFHKFSSVRKFKQKDYRVREQLYAFYPGMKGRLHFRSEKEDGEWIVHLLQQLHDEIEPHILLTSIKM